VIVMARRSHARQDRLSLSYAKVEKAYHRGTPLAAVAEKLAQVIRICQDDLRAGVVNHEDAIKLAAYVDGVIERLPSSFGERFRFDGGMIQALADEWSQGCIQLSK
jgi:hypothetical protein